MFKTNRRTRLFFGACAALVLFVIVVLAVNGGRPMSPSHGSQPTSGASIMAGPIGGGLPACSSASAAKATATAASIQSQLASVGYHLMSSSATTAYSADAHACYYSANWTNGHLTINVLNDQVETIGTMARWVSVPMVPLRTQLAVATRALQTPSIWQMVEQNASSDNGYSKDASVKLRVDGTVVAFEAYAHD